MLSATLSVSGDSIETVTKNAQNGKYDVDKIIGILERMVGKETSEKIIRDIQARSDRGEKISMSMIMDLMKKVDFSKIKSKTESGEINASDLQSDLAELVGEKQTEKIFSDARDVVEEIKKEEKDEDDGEWFFNIIFIDYFFLFDNIPYIEPQIQNISNVIEAIFVCIHKLINKNIDEIKFITLYISIFGFCVCIIKNAQTIPIIPIYPIIFPNNPMFISL